MSTSRQFIEGKTCLITGATNGIGRVTAVALARMGAELFLICRNKARCDAANPDDQHWPCSIAAGELFLKRVYDDLFGGAGLIASSPNRWKLNDD